MEDEEKYDFLYKILLIGDSGVGKTCLISRFTKNQFLIEQQPTIGVEFSTRQVKIQGKNIKTQIWDTAGQERYRAITSAYYRGAVGAMIVFDVTKPSSFENLHKWYKELREHSNDQIVPILIGNKSDMSDVRCVSTATAASFAQEYNMAYLETSALQSTKVDEAFYQLIQYIYDLNLKTNTVEKTTRVNNKQGQPIQTFPLDKPTMQLANSNQSQSSKKSSCC